MKKPAAKIDKEWYVDWFDSPYYFQLYRDRDETEAQGFIARLLDFLAVPERARVLDLACGRGRYSVFLAEKGLAVTGIDLAPSSIAYAQKMEGEHLHFYQHDMRQPFRTNYYHYIFNFFTSFGYFHREHDDLRILKNVAAALKKDGKFVLDFFNSDYITAHLNPSYQKTVGGLRFHIHKHLDPAGYIIKRIEFRDQGQDFQFTERVRIFRLEDFHRLFRLAGLKIVHTFGDYQLNPFDSQRSPRLILLAEHDGTTRTS